MVGKTKGLSLGDTQNSPVVSVFEIDFNENTKEITISKEDEENEEK